MSQETTAHNGGVGFLGLLTVAFVVLKLTGVIAWSWWWVLAPTWAPIALILFCMLVYIFCMDRT